MLGAIGTREAGVRGRQLAVYQWPALVLLLGMAALTVLSMVHASPLAVTRSVSLAAAISAASLLIVLGAAFFALGEYLLYGLVASLCISLAFLVFAAAEAGLGLIPLLVGWDSDVGWIPYGWALERIAGGALLVGAALLVHHTIPVYRRSRVAVVGLLLVGLYALFVTSLVYAAGSQAAVNPLQSWLQLLAGMLFFLATMLFWRIFKTSSRTWFLWLGSSLAMAGFAQIQYTLHYSAVGVVQTGDALRLIFFSGILLALAAEWSQNYRRLRWQARILEATHTLMIAPMVQDVAAVVQHIERVAALCLHGSAHLWIPEREGRRVDDVLVLQMLQTGRPLPPANLAAHGYALDRQDGVATRHVAIGVAMRTADKRLGMLIVERAGSEQFSAHDVRLLRSFGAQASILLERSMLYEEIEAGAIMNERHRLAREIHDGLAQHLAFLKMRVSWLRRTPATIDVSHLQDVEGVLETALIEARHAITTLRAEPLGTSTVEAIGGYAEEFGQVSGIEMVLPRPQDVPEAGPKSRVELLRIVQESLNNVRKHARATRVEIDVRERDGGLEVSVCDDGIGFVTSGGARGHFGLQIMRERAESVGGKLDVESQPGAGTAVTIWVPGHEAEPVRGDDDYLGLPQR